MCCFTCETDPGLYSVQLRAATWIEAFHSSSILGNNFKVCSHLVRSFFESITDIVFPLRPLALDPLRFQCMLRRVPIISV